MSVTDELLRNAEAYAARFDKGDLPLAPGKRVAVVACMDARRNVYGLLGLQEGDAHVIRNAGGAITDDEIRSLADADEDVRQSVARIHASPFIPHKSSVRGFVYEVESGRLREVA